MELDPGYKQTEVGVIPEDWGVSSVGREYEIKLGKMLDAEKNVGVPKPYLGNRAVQWDRIDVSDLPTVPMSRSDLERFRLEKGDLLVCEGGEVGRAAIWEAPIEECYYQKALHRLRPLRGFNSHVMAAFLRRWSDCGLLANYVTQTSIAHLPREKFMQVPMPVPPPPEQLAIATALSDVDGMLGGLDQLIAKRRDLKQAAMQQLLTGQIRLPGFHGEWEVKRLDEVADVIDPHPSHRAPVEISSGAPFVGIGDLDESGNIVGIKLRRVNRSVLIEHAARYNINDQLIGLGRVASIGKVVCLKPQPEDYAISPTLGIIRGRTAKRAYLLYALRSKFITEQFSRIMSGSTRSSVGMEVLRKLHVSLPPTPEEQTAIAEVLTDIDAELAAFDQRRDKTRALKQAMMQELLTGRTRLV